MEFARLPNEILLEIGDLCTVKSIASLRAVNHHFYEVCSDIFYKKFAIPASKDLVLPKHCSPGPSARAIDHGWTLLLPPERYIEGYGNNSTASGKRSKCECASAKLMDSVASWGEIGEKAGGRGFFLEFGADIDALDEHGMSPLICASDEGDTEMVRLLLENGAKVNWPEKDYYTQHADQIDPGTPLHIAGNERTRRWLKICWSLERILMLILLKDGADVEVGDWGRALAVLDYATWKNEGIVTILEVEEGDYWHDEEYDWHIEEYEDY
ncbi:hypothetical protein FPQ18DRAFT_421597 [Pyronema domesticum]|nr:hypothetical protein FPQ18DRAFT_421597 [Pyronema domesticum]